MLFVIAVAMHTGIVGEGSIYRVGSLVSYGKLKPSILSVDEINRESTKRDNFQ